MRESYDPQRSDASLTPDMSGERMLEITTMEYESLPEIHYLDDYIHLQRQLEDMRARGGNNTHKFAMELALLFRLNDYDRRVGLPELEMPGESQ